MARRYVILDVFTDKALAGNPLAVVLDSDGLDTDAMQRIAAEFNLSETVFVEPPPRPGLTAKVRIFTTVRELPFAGHPTVGTAVLLAAERLDGVARETDAVVVLQEQIGIVRCGVVLAPNRPGRAVFDIPKLPEEMPFRGDVGLAASALGLDRQDIGFENHVPTVFSAGNPFVFVPIRDLAAMGSMALNMGAWEAAFGDRKADVYVYTRECAHADGDFHARMFGPSNGIPRIRPPDRRLRPSPARSCASTAPPTASARSSSSRATRWAGRAGSSWRSSSRRAGSTAPASEARR